MKFTIATKELKSGLDTVMGAVSLRSTLPTLAGVLFTCEPENKYVTLRATNLVYGVTALADAEIEDGGSVVVPAKTLKDMVDAIGADEIEFALNAKTMTVKVLADSMTANLKGLDAADFPEPHEIQGDVVFAFETEPLMNALRQAFLSAEVKGDRPVIHGVCFDIRNKHLTLMGGDGFRASVVGMGEVKAKKDAQFIIPFDSIKPLLDCAKNAEGGVTVALNSKSAEFLWAGLTFQTQLVDEAQYPNLAQVVSAWGTDVSVSVDRKELDAALKQAMVFSRSGLGAVAFGVKDKMLTVTSLDSQDGDYRNEMLCGGDKEISFALAGRYVAEWLGATKGDDVVIETDASAKAVHLRDGNPDFRYTVMALDRGEK